MTGLRGMVGGRVLEPGDDGFDVARKAWNLAVDQPVAAVAEAADAAAVVRHARRSSLTVTAQASGHDASGDVEGVILLRTGRLDGVRVHVPERLAEVGAGVKWGQVLEATGGASMTRSTRTCFGPCDQWQPYRLLDADGAVVEPAAVCLAAVVRTGATSGEGSRPRAGSVPKCVGSTRAMGHLLAGLRDSVRPWAGPDLDPFLVDPAKRASGHASLTTAQAPDRTGGLPAWRRPAGGRDRSGEAALPPETAGTTRGGFRTIGGTSSTRGLFAKALVAARSPIRPEALLTTLEASAERSPIVETLREHGLISSARIRALRKWGPHALLLAWLVLGVVRFVVSAQQSGPDGRADLLPVFAAVFIGGFSFVFLFVDTSVYLTPAGAALVYAQRLARKGVGAEEVLAWYDPWLRRAEGAVVISGPGDYPDQHVRAVLHSCRPPPRREYPGGL